jgi:hypothetical protein
VTKKRNRNKDASRYTCNTSSFDSLILVAMLVVYKIPSLYCFFSLKSTLAMIARPAAFAEGVLAHIFSSFTPPRYSRGIVIIYGIEMPRFWSIFQGNFRVWWMFSWCAGPWVEGRRMISKFNSTSYFVGSFSCSCLPPSSPVMNYCIMYVWIIYLCPKFA